MRKIIFFILIASLANLMADSNRERALFYYYKGCALLNSEGNLLEALHCLNHAISLCPNESTAWEVRGAICLLLQNFSQTIKDCSQAIKLNPNNAQAYLGRALGYFKLRNMNAAKADIVIAARLGLPDAQSIARAWQWSY